MKNYNNHCLKCSRQYEGFEPYYKNKRDPLGMTFCQQCFALLLDKSENPSWTIDGWEFIDPFEFVETENDSCCSDCYIYDDKDIK